jgi:hypothetical protein
VGLFCLLEHIRIFYRTSLSDIFCRGDAACFLRLKNRLIKRYLNERRLMKFTTIKTDNFLILTIQLVKSLFGTLSVIKRFNPLLYILKKVVRISTSKPTVWNA